MRWNDCYSGPSAEFNRVFACGTNAGVHPLYLSVVHTALLENVSGCEFTIGVYSSTATLPAWWQFFNAGACRRTSLQMVDPTGITGCAELWYGQSLGGIAAYNINYYGPGSARIRAVLAVPLGALGTLEPGTETTVGRLTITSTATVGTGSCAGCTTPVCLAFLDAKLTTPVAANDVTLTQPALADDSHWVSWRDGTSTSLGQCVSGSLRGLRVSAP